MKSILLGVVLGFMSFSIQAVDCNVFFAAPTEREDNTSMTVSDIDHYTFEIVQSDGTITEFIVPPEETQFTMDVIPGWYIARGKTFDTNLRQSVWSIYAILRCKDNPQPPSVGGCV